MAPTEPTEAFPFKPPEPKPDVVYYRAADLAKRYNVHLITIYKWAANGTLPKGELIAPNSRRWRSDLIEAFEWARQKVQSK